MINETRTEVVDINRCDYVGKHYRKCLSWSAIIAGALVAFVISFLLNLFGVAIGLAAFTNTQEGVSTFAIGGFIGLIIISIAAMFVGGMVSGYLGRRYCVRRNLGILYGILSFGVALFLAVMLTVPATNFLSHYNSGLYRSTQATAVIANPASESSTIVSSRGTTTHGPALDSTNSKAAATTEQNANDLGKAAFLTFIIFAIGALSACIGGHCGMRCKCDEDYIEEVDVKRTL